MLTPAQFYAKYDANDPFGNIRPATGRAHLGSDFPWAEGTEIPSWVAGVVSAAGFNSVIGWYVIIRTARGWAGFYHLRAASPVQVGQAVSFGQLVGIVGNTGSASIGAHLHVMWSTTDGTPGTGSVSDPYPAIRAALRKESNMQGWQFTPGGQRVLADPISMTYRYVGGFEADVFIQDGGSFHPLGEPHWSQQFGKYREIKKPDTPTAGSSTPAPSAPAIDYGKLGAATAKALVDGGALNLVLAGTVKPAAVKK